MHPVEQFLQNGLLPFVGREEEISQILSLWRGTAESGRLGGLLLTAEAGSGKSRLLEEAIVRVRSEGGSVIHAKLYPEANNELAGIIASPLDRELPHPGGTSTETGQTIAGVVSRLSRASRLRRTLLVLEDIHLLPVEAYSDLANLLRGLADETLSLLVAARPVQLGSRGILEPWLVGSIEVRGLSLEEIGLLWKRLFGKEASRGVLRIIDEETLGNPLALRSALRGAIEAGSIASHRSGEWRVKGSLESLQSVVRGSVAAVVEGLLAGLSPERRVDAGRVAILGEVVARETVEELTGGTDPIEDLLSANLLVRTGHPVPPLPALDTAAGGGAGSWSYPGTRLPLLAFTHSLVHSRLSEERSGIDTDVLRVAAQNYPLYSLLPLSIPGDTRGLEEVPTETVLGLLERIRLVAQLLDRTSNWRESARVWEGSARLVENLDGRIPQEEFRFQQLRQAIISLSLIGRRDTASERWQEILHQAEELSTTAETERFAYARLLLACHLVEHGIREGNARAVLARTDSIVEQITDTFPSFVGRPAYIYYLETVGHVAAQIGDESLVADLEQKTRDLLAMDGLPPPIRTLAVGRLLKFTLLFFTSREELEDRRRLMEQIEEETEENDPYYGMMKVTFLMEVGEFERAIELAEEVADACREIGTLLNRLNCLGTIQIARSMISYERDRCRQAMSDVLGESWPDERSEMIRAKVYSWVHDVSLLTGDDELIRVFRDLVPEGSGDSPGERAMLGIWERDPKAFGEILEVESREEVRVGKRAWETWRRIVADREESVEAALALLRRPHLRLTQVTETVGTLHLTVALGLHSDNPELVDAGIDACVRGLRWLFEKKAPGGAAPLMALLDELGEIDAAAEWLEKFALIAAVQKKVDVSSESENESAVPEKISLSMLGKIRIAIPPEKYAPVRGVRIRTILGLMAANEMLERPLSGAEFTHLAGGGDPDPEHARKKKNMGVVRIREIVGREAVLTDGECPVLNSEMVDVDLLRVHHLVMGATDALSEGSIVRAIAMASQAFDLLDGEVPFPTLYDDFFEAARSDFDRRLRNVLIGIGAGMRREGETSEGIELLRRGVAERPGDEELAEILAELLQRRGEDVEAERIRMGSGG